MKEPKERPLLIPAQAPIRVEVAVGLRDVGAPKGYVDFDAKGCVAAERHATLAEDAHDNGVVGRVGVTERWRSAPRVYSHGRNVDRRTDIGAQILCPCRSGTTQHRQQQCGTRKNLHSDSRQCVVLRCPPLPRPF